MIREWLCTVSFFFSSRRRHTRFDCDWSSDVCSSDLEAGNLFAVAFGPPVVELRFYMREDDPSTDAIEYERFDPQSQSAPRSEERRVGKECRSGWWADHEKQ